MPSLCALAGGSDDELAAAAPLQVLAGRASVVVESPMPAGFRKGRLVNRVVDNGAAHIAKVPRTMARKIVDRYRTLLNGIRRSEMLALIGPNMGERGEGGSGGQAGWERSVEHSLKQTRGQEGQA